VPVGVEVQVAELGVPVLRITDANCVLPGAFVESTYLAAVNENAPGAQPAAGGVMTAGDPLASLTVKVTVGTEAPVTVVASAQVIVLMVIEPLYRAIVAALLWKLFWLTNPSVA
jgi:hypothetical protein